MSASRWSRALTLLLFLFVCLPCNAEEYGLLKHVTLKEYPSGSFVVKYGGLEGLVRTQLTNYFHVWHRDSIQFRYYNRPLKARAELIEMGYRQSDVDNGGAWFKRDWWDSLPEEKGGAPRYPIRVFRGPTGNLIDVGFAYLTADFRFKWRQYEINLTEALDPVSDPGTNSVSERAYQWRLRVKPHASFSTSDIIRQVRLGLFFEQFHKRIKRISIETYASWHPMNSIETVWFGFSISFLRW